MISIVIPLYNVAAYIEKCLLSIYNQTYTDYEIIIVDDGSTDDSYNKSVAFKQLYPNLKVSILQKKNEGVTTARRDGVRAAKGDWVTFVDADDTLPVTALETLVLGVDNDVNIVVGAHNLYDENGHFRFCPNKNLGKFTSKKYISIFILGKVEGAPWAKLFRRVIFNDEIFDLPREIKNKEDVIMNVRIAVLQHQKVVFLDKAVYNYLTDRKDSALTLYKDTFDLDYEVRILNYIKSALIKEGFFLMFKKEVALLYLRNVWSWRKKIGLLNNNQFLIVKQYCDFILKHNLSLFGTIKIAVIYLLLLLSYFKNQLFRKKELSV